MEDKTKPMCRSGCGCFGNPATDGLCSICYKALVAKKQSRLNSSSIASSNSCSGRGSFESKMTFVEIKSNESMTTSSPVLETNIVETHKNFKVNTDTRSSESNTSCSSNKDDHEKNRGKAIRKSLRCAAENCRRKLGLTHVQCRCGEHFCAIHRYSDRHECTFDYRGLGAQEIRRKNPKVVGEKIRKI